MKREELKRLFDSEDFTEKLRKVNSFEALQSFLAENNVHMTVDEITKAARSDTELDEKELYSVCGGNTDSWIAFAWKCFSLKISEEE